MRLLDLDQLTLAPPAACSFREVDVEPANLLLKGWGHYLGPANRPFGQQAWVLEVGGLPVSVAVSASAVSATTAGYDRRRLVELARLCSSPSNAWATRVMLRLWREVALPAWPYWPAEAAIAYSKNDRHEGRIYRFDGWRRAGDESAGRKSLWLWERAA